MVRYAGRGRELAPLSAELLVVEPLPARARAAATQSITVEVRNTGRRPWNAGGLFPVAIGYRLVTGTRGQVVQRGSIPLAHGVRPGQTIEADLDLRWPEQPGTYQLVLDLLREPVGDLRRLGRLVVWSTEVVVESPISPDTPTP